MKAVIQRVTSARVRVEQSIAGEIQEGLLVFLGIGRSDDQSDVDLMVKKIPSLRIFEDQQGKMNLSLLDRGGAVLLVSQFTLYGDCRKGLRPSFGQAEEPGRARELFGTVQNGLIGQGLEVKTGIFGAFMQVELVNDGPVTILLDTEERRS